MSNHTPSPWIVKHFDNYGDILIDAPAKRGSGLLCRVFPPKTVLDVGTKDEKWLYTEQDVAECEANARLIAAAPELLAALKDIIDNSLIVEDICPFCGRDVSDNGVKCTASDCMGVIARAAIAKATGNVR